MRTRRATTRWHGGWWSAASPVPSPNFGPRPEGAPIDLVVLHSISLPPGVLRGDAVQRLFTNTLDCNRHRYFDALRDLRVSAHFFVRRDGRVIQFVDAGQRAWHAGVSHWRGRDNCNDRSIGIEIEGLEGRTFAAAQYRVLARLLRDVVRRYPIVDIVGHEHVAPGRKRDPGARFDWLRLARALHGCGAHVWPHVAAQP